jgi:hypothetical protein
LTQINDPAHDASGANLTLGTHLTADDFYAGITPDTLTRDEAHVMRQALSGMLWSKQYFYYDLAQWLREHGDKPEQGVRAQVRNKDWFHMWVRLWGFNAGGCADVSIFEGEDGCRAALDRAAECRGNGAGLIATKEEAHAQFHP